MASSPVRSLSAAAVGPVSFADAVPLWLGGKKLTRQAWGSPACVFLHAGVLHFRAADGTLHTLIVSDGDLDATDWVLAREV